MPINKIDRVVLNESVRESIDEKATKIQVNDLRIELENKINDMYSNLVRKESVPTFNDIRTTYPNPKEGWTVTVDDTNITYQYDEDTDTWIKTSINAIPKASSVDDGLMRKEDKSKLDGIENGAQANRTPQETLADLLTVDGLNSGLDSDTLRGKIPSDFATFDHLHDGRYYTQTQLNTKLGEKANKLTVDNHIANVSNPHSVTKSQVGLGNVDNIQQATKSEFNSHIGNTKNPHNVTKSQIGLGSVENKSSSTIRGEITSLNIENSLGFSPESKANKGIANGYASLDSNTKIPLYQLPDTAKQQTYVVLNGTERGSLTGLIEGDKCFETSTGDSYIWGGISWMLMADADWANVSLEWSNINSKPTSLVSSIDDAVNKRHTHSNKSVLDGTSASFTTILKSKLDGIASNANNYTHPSSHPATMITEDSSHRFVTDSEKSTWNAKETPSGAQSKVNAHANNNTIHITSSERTYWDGKAEGNHTHSELHTHGNKSILDKLSQTGTETSFDLSKFVTSEELGSAGYGDMIKSTYDANNNGIVDNSEKVGGILPSSFLRGDQADTMAGSLTLTHGNGTSGDIGRIYGGSDNNKYIEIDGGAGDYIKFVVNGVDIGKYTASGLNVTGALSSSGSVSGSSISSSSTISATGNITSGGQIKSSGIFNTTGDMSLRANNITRMTVKDSTGNVGIGTTAPSEKLDVSGNIKASGNVTAGSTLSAPTVSASGEVQSGTGFKTGNFLINYNSTEDSLDFSYVG